MALFTDQTGREVRLVKKPTRIISTVPSQTELLADLGLESEVIGITAFCVHPQDWLKHKAVVGGTKDLQLDKIRSLEPDLIIGNKEENVKNQIKSLANDIPVWLSDVETVDQALEMISSVGQITGREKNALKLRSAAEQLRAKLPPKQQIKAAYFIWKDPFMLAGPSSFISAMLAECGVANAAPVNQERYPQVTIEDLKKLDIDILLLSSEPYAFTTGDAHDLAREINKPVKIIDGELFSWYGSRMARAFSYFERFRKELDLILKVGK